jgi:hypothetical protein
LSLAVSLHTMLVGFYVAAAAAGGCLGDFRHQSLAAQLGGALTLRRPGIREIGRSPGAADAPNRRRFPTPFLLWVTVS